MMHDTSWQLNPSLLVNAPTTLEQPSTLDLTKSWFEMMLMGIIFLLIYYVLMATQLNKTYLMYINSLYVHYVPLVL